MNKFLQLDPLRLGAIFLTVAAIAMIFLPPPSRTLPAMPAVNATIAETAPVLSSELAGRLFNLANLPAIEIPPPAPVIVDIAAALKRHTLLGVTLNETSAIALVSDGARQISLEEGAVLAGFEVIRIMPRQVDFRKDGVTASLSLPDIGIDKSQ